MKHILFLLFLVLSALLLFTTIFFFRETKLFISRASVSQTSFSVDNSYVFVTPLRAQANGLEKIRINVFVLNNQGLGVLGKQIILGMNPDLTVEAVQGATDQYGKAVFDISSKKTGDYYLEIRVDDIVLPQKAHLSFY